MFPRRNGRFRCFWAAALVLPVLAMGLAGGPAWGAVRTKGATFVYKKVQSVYAPIWEDPNQWQATYDPADAGRTDNAWPGGVPGVADRVVFDTSGGIHVKTRLERLESMTIAESVEVGISPKLGSSGIVFQGTDIRLDGSLALHMPVAGSITTTGDGKIMFFKPFALTAPATMDLKGLKAVKFQKDILSTTKPNFVTIIFGGEISFFDGTPYNPLRPPLKIESSDTLFKAEGQNASIQGLSDPDPDSYVHLDIVKNDPDVATKLKLRGKNIFHLSNTRFDELDLYETTIVVPSLEAEKHTVFEHGKIIPTGEDLTVETTGKDIRFIYTNIAVPRTLILNGTGKVSVVPDKVSGKIMNVPKVVVGDAELEVYTRTLSMNNTTVFVVNNGKLKPDGNFNFDKNAYYECTGTGILETHDDTRIGAEAFRGAIRHHGLGLIFESKDALKLASSFEAESGFSVKSDVLNTALDKKVTTYRGLSFAEQGAKVGPEVVFRKGPNLDRRSIGFSFAPDFTRPLFSFLPGSKGFKNEWDNDYFELHINVILSDDRIPLVHDPDGNVIKKLGVPAMGYIEVFAKKNKYVSEKTDRALVVENGTLYVEKKPTPPPPGSGTGGGTPGSGGSQTPGSGGSQTPGSGGAQSPGDGSDGGSQTNPGQGGSGTGSVPGGGAGAGGTQGPGGGQGTPGGGGTNANADNPATKDDISLSGPGKAGDSKFVFVGTGSHVIRIEGNGKDFGLDIPAFDAGGFGGNATITWSRTEPASGERSPIELRIDIVRLPDTTVSKGFNVVGIVKGTPNNITVPTGLELTVVIKAPSNPATKDDISFSGPGKAGDSKFVFGETGSHVIKIEGNGKDFGLDIPEAGSAEFGGDVSVTWRRTDPVSGDRSPIELRIDVVRLPNTTVSKDLNIVGIVKDISSNTTVPTGRKLTIVIEAPVSGAPGSSGGNSGNDSGSQTPGTGAVPGGTQGPDNSGPGGGSNGSNAGNQGTQNPGTGDGGSNQSGPGQGQTPPQGQGPAQGQNPAGTVPPGPATKDDISFSGPGKAGDSKFVFVGTGSHVIRIEGNGKDFGLDIPAFDASGFGGNATITWSRTEPASGERSPIELRIDIVRLPDIAVSRDLNIVGIVKGAQNDAVVPTGRKLTIVIETSPSDNPVTNEDLSNLAPIGIPESEKNNLKLGSPEGWRVVSNDAAFDSSGKKNIVLTFKIDHDAELSQLSVLGGGFDSDILRAKRQSAEPKQGSGPTTSAFRIAAEMLHRDASIKGVLYREIGDVPGTARKVPFVKPILVRDLPGWIERVDDPGRGTPGTPGGNKPNAPGMPPESPRAPDGGAPKNPEKDDPRVPDKEEPSDPGREGPQIPERPETPNDETKGGGGGCDAGVGGLSLLIVLTLLRRKKI